jgi:hypothetical protein
MIMLYSILSFAAVLLCIGLAIFGYYRDTRSFTHQVFAVGMVALALEAALTGLSIQAISYAEVVRWQRLRVVVTALLPGTWLLFSLSFARVNYGAFLATWRWVVLASFAFPLVLVIFFNRLLFIDLPALDASSRWVLGMGWAGYAFSLFFLLGTVLILLNLERTLRASIGSIRWQIKFMILGLGGVFVVRVYTGSQALLFSSINIALEGINTGVLVVASVLIFASFVRTRLSGVNVYFSHTALFSSLTVLIVGIYLLTVGLLAKAVSYWGGGYVSSLTTL